MRPAVPRPEVVIEERNTLPPKRVMGLRPGQRATARLYQIIFITMAQYKVKGEEGATEVDILGTNYPVDEVVELEVDAAAPLVEEGKLEAVEAAA